MEKIFDEKGNLFINENVIDENIENYVNKPISKFNYEYFKSLKSFSARKKYCNATLFRLTTAGSSRDVYHLTDQYVLKLAKNKLGLIQNDRECGLGRDKYFEEIVSKVYDCDPDDLWVISENAKKITPQQFFSITGLNIKELSNYFDYKYKYTTGYKLNSYEQNFVNEYEEKNSENEYLHILIELIDSYEILSGDMGKINSYGVVNRNGKQELVLIDYGLDRDDFKTHYEKPRQQKYQRRLYEGVQENSLSMFIKNKIKELYESHNTTD
jgi:hypothetical protein